MGDRATVGGRRGYWVPLVLLGFGLLGLLAWDSARAGQDIDWFAYAPLSESGGLVSTQMSANTTVVAVFEQERYPPRDWPWPALITVTLVATMAWYGWRARQAGGSARTHIAVAVVGAVAVPTCYVAAGMADAVGAVGDSAGMSTSVGLPLVVLGALAGVWAYLRPGQWRRVAAVVSAVCLAVGVGSVLGAWAPGLLDPVLIAGGLLVLARFERSPLPAVVAGVVLLAMALFPTGTLSTLVPGAAAIAAGIVALATRQATTPEPT